MGTYQNAATKKQAGFTLVELAVVMIIIGLLIGGVLKGQELIANAQITSTASATKGIDAATTTFRDTYAAMPGDMANAGARLPNCAGACVVGAGAGLGNSRVDGDVTAAPTAEMIAFWQQLSAADLISGIDTNQGNAFGGNFPAAPVGGGFHAAFDNSAGLGTNANSRAGHYLVLHDNAGGAPAGTAISALQGARIDRKLDDGVSNTGTVFENGGGCGDANGVYQEANGNARCDLFIRFQN